MSDESPGCCTRNAGSGSLRPPAGLVRTGPQWTYEARPNCRDKPVGDSGRRLPGRGVQLSPVSTTNQRPPESEIGVREGVSAALTVTVTVTKTKESLWLTEIFATSSSQTSN